MNSHTEENYLKAIYSLSTPEEETVSTNAIAKALRTKAGSVTDMLKKLSEKKLIHYRRYQGVYLTNAGKKVALKVIRKHRLWETFLVAELRFRWDQVHEIAEQLEHIQSEELITKLDNYLGNPKMDPHGDPIPDHDGKVAPDKSSTLAQLEKGEHGIMTGVVDHSAAFLQYLDKMHLSIGTVLHIKDINAFDQSLVVMLSSKEQVTLSREVVHNILVQKKNLK